MRAIAVFVAALVFSGAAIAQQARFAEIIKQGGIRIE